MTDKKFYTYAYLRSKDSETAKAGTPYYVGKGHGKRAYDSSHNVKVPDDKNRIIFLKQNLTEEEAFNHERYMIALLGRKDLGLGILLNRSDGGEGHTNPSPEFRKKMRENVLNRLKGENKDYYKEVLSKNGKNNYAKGIGIASEESKQKLKDLWENDPEWSARQKETRRQTAKKSYAKGIGIGAYTKEEMSAKQKALFEGEKGEYYRQISAKNGRDNYAKGIGIATEWARQKANKNRLEKIGLRFTIRDPDGKIHTGLGVLPFAKKHGLDCQSLERLVKGKIYFHKGWYLAENDPLLPLKLFREGKTKKEVKEITGVSGATYPTKLFPLPKEGYKWCSCCFNELPLREFGNTTTRTGNIIKRSWCTPCHRNYRDWKKKNNQ